jgi:hypothetical protein
LRAGSELASAVTASGDQQRARAVDDRAHVGAFLTDLGADELGLEPAALEGVDNRRAVGAGLEVRDHVAGGRARDRRAGEDHDLAVVVRLDVAAGELDLAPRRAIEVSTTKLKELSL